MNNSSEEIKSLNKNSNLNKLEKIKRIIKYILMGFIILVAVRYIPNQPINTKEIIMIGLISSISFAMLDMVSPSIKVINKS
jgi:hypothetical protein|uniref:Uncharacterized protein n=1 Tax=viral metagenome TaxID=1070528 RepID=A0A6C0ITJ8_9ZZZZ